MKTYTFADRFFDPLSLMQKDNGTFANKFTSNTLSKEAYIALSVLFGVCTLGIGHLIYGISEKMRGDVTTEAVHSVALSRLFSSQPVKVAVSMQRNDPALLSGLTDYLKDNLGRDLIFLESNDPLPQEGIRICVQNVGSARIDGVLDTKTPKNFANQGEKVILAAVTLGTDFLRNLEDNQEAKPYHPILLSCPSREEGFYDKRIEKWNEAALDTFLSHCSNLLGVKKVDASTSDVRDVQIIFDKSGGNEEAVKYLRDVLPGVNLEVKQFDDYDPSIPCFYIVLAVGPKMEGMFFEKNLEAISKKGKVVPVFIKMTGTPDKKENVIGFENWITINTTFAGYNIRANEGLKEQLLSRISA